MKITPTALASLTSAIEPLDTTERRERYLAGDFPRADAVKDLNMRYRWDIYWVAQADPTTRTDVGPLNTEHIDTALRRIVPALAPQA